MTATNDAARDMAEQAEAFERDVDYNVGRVLDGLIDEVLEAAEDLREHAYGRAAADESRIAHVRSARVMAAVAARLMRIKEDNTYGSQD